MEPVLLYITATSREEAILLSRELVAERLAACANIIEHVTSLYRWQTEMEQATEVVVIAKTVASQVEAVTQRVKALHSHACPCVVAVPITGGNPDYIAWIGEQVASHD